MIRQYQGSPRVSEAATSLILFFLNLIHHFVSSVFQERKNNRVDIVSSVCLLSPCWLSG